MASVSVPESSSSWTIAQLQTAKAEQRTTWTQAIEASADAAAQAIAKSIIADLATRLQQWLGDAYRPDPSLSEKLMRTYSLSLPESASQVKEWMGDTGQSEPFASWFGRFAEPSKEALKVASESSKIILIQRSSNIDKEFFRSVMAKVGELVAGYVKRDLEVLQKVEGNEKLRSQVEWYRTEVEWYRTEGDVGMSSLKSPVNNNSVKVSLWLEEQKQESSGWGGYFNFQST